MNPTNLDALLLEFQTARRRWEDAARLESRLFWNLVQKYPDDGGSIPSLAEVGHLVALLGVRLNLAQRAWEAAGRLRQAAEGLEEC